MKLVKITEEANAYTTDVITNESTNTTINKEDKEMSNNNTTKNVNANVNETKEEKTMTTANNTNIFAAFNQAQVELEEKFNESFAADAQAARGFATKDRVGINSVTVESIKSVIVKFAGNPKKGTMPKFTTAYEVNLGDDLPSFKINNQAFLYKDDKRVEDVDIVMAITNGSGDHGVYYTANEAAMDKSADDLTAEDLTVHELKAGERIFRPAKKELEAIKDQLRVGTLTFDDEGNIKMRKTRMTVYVYEDVIEEKTKRMNKNDKVAEFVKYVYFYNASFISPEDQPTSKYGRVFTSSKNAQHRKEFAELPGVAKYQAGC